MAVYTEVSDDDLAGFVAGYDVGHLTSFKGIAEGVENTNYLVQTDRGRFILTLYEKRVDSGDLPFFLGLLDHLAARGIPCPTPLRDRSGAMLRELAGRPAALVSFLDGMWVRRPGVAHCRALGTALARLHLAARDYEGHRENALTVPAWRALIDACGDRLEEIEPGLAGELHGELETFERAWPSSLPRGIVHADLFPDNVFFLGEKLVGLIDFYFACTDCLAYDIAICLNAWCFEVDGAFNVTKARALLEAYGRIRPLTEEEFEALPLLARGAAMRFLATRAYDWLNTPANAFVSRKDPMEYVRRLRFHRGVAGTGEYGLDR
ncbi:homoserine kinase [Kaustia mangrovi]|uniref:Homoserine kinase n=1 Tax=Kaustia mangrovi TaxID=2593653 RepID=A0A7S8C2D8_9HYPH|nr:homoserine kinase [Kaustia mangrovi]QPC42124.1 homoserine kinase [Kaustia mangrovi]